MKSLLGLVSETIWNEIPKSGKYTTPDLQKGPSFQAKKTSKVVNILTSGKTSFPIPKEAFTAALKYLIEHGLLNKDTSCEVNASQTNPGPLNKATRKYTADRMNISYILPILAPIGLVGIDGKRKNKIWTNIY